MRRSVAPVSRCPLGTERPVKILRSVRLKAPDGNCNVAVTGSLRPASQNRMLRVTKRVRPQPAARGPSVTEGFAVLVESFASATL